ncbi:histidine phosphatase family protein [Corynebacterium sp. TAE3-ERU12]|uniref:histidine phosphatase family protein n=1 Tax=Corynebacterium sp. TAE3-ERU12 TaxID=2849491 RepID=UPI001C467D05|nr:histidine phosphatase family protein [Corynebacterium sp. TAE3-ERU12]MBV7296082.1 histidine phosphatase family protein [Corynebacterium sp. TAE3-ERU12]
MTTYAGADRLILIRHGQTHANIAKMLDTALPGAPLTDSGVIQARRLGTTLLDYGTPLQTLVTSQALRARQTGVGAVATMHHHGRPDIHLRHTADLQEVSAGELEGRTDIDAHRDFLRLFQQWTHGEPEEPAPGGESGQDVLDRYLAALQKLLADDAVVAPGGTLAVVTHGAAMRLVGQHLGGVDGDFVVLNRMPNTGRIVLQRAKADAAEPVGYGSWKVTSWGETHGDIPVLGLG